VDITPFVVAVAAHKWLLLSALIVNLAVATAKQGWLSMVIARRLTPAATPYYALLVSVLTAASGDIISGKSWQSAITDSVAICFTAMAAHQFVVESFRKGKELIPATKAAAAFRHPSPAVNVSSPQ